MPCISYVPRKFSADVQAIIAQANVIINEYAAQGYDLTLRQLYYQFVSRDILPNTVQSYKRLGSIINDARLAGLIDWDRIEDRTRNLQALAHWSSPESIIDVCARQYRTDKWQKQPHRIEVWIEKEALAGVFQGVCQQLDVPYFSCRGYVSQSEMWAAAQRMSGYGTNKVTQILHFGDHDPSGIDMTRDIESRLKMFGAPAKIHRLALTMDQVEEYEPPPNPAKATDARFAQYQEEYGDESWELDALEPAVLTQLVQTAVLEWRNESLWDRAVAHEQQERHLLEQVRDNWEEIVEWL